MISAFLFAEAVACWGSIKNVVPKTFAKFTRKHLRWSLFFSKAGLEPTAFSKKRLWQRHFTD